ncbi:unnamed protein product, partial [Polarella glacialis]
VLPPWDGVETMISKLWDIMDARFSYTWCKDSASHHGGLAQKVLVLDGHQKGNRSHCAAQSCNAIRNDFLHMSIPISCPATPVPGSWYCREHVGEDVAASASVAAGGVITHVYRHRSQKPRGDLLYFVSVEDAPCPVWIQESLVPTSALQAYRANACKTTALTHLSTRVRLSTKSKAEELHEEHYELSCTTDKEKQTSLKAERTAGILLAAYPLGIVPGFTELFGSESRRQRYAFVAKIVAVDSFVKLVVHDDACHMAKYCQHVNRFIDDDIKERSYVALSWAPLRVLMSDLLWSLDRFHASNHTRGAMLMFGLHCRI